MKQELEQMRHENAVLKIEKDQLTTLLNNERKYRTQLKEEIEVT